MTIAIDFAPGLHGHFLEYVLNRYLFDVKYNLSTVFQSSGAMHTINRDDDYQKNKIVTCGHYSSGNNPLPDDVSYTIFIKHDPKLDFILLCNIYYRCHPDAKNAFDFDVQKILNRHLVMMKNDSVTPVELQANWFAKLHERHFEMTERYPATTVPIFNFDYASFFSLPAFLQELKRVSKFLNITFNFDQTLSRLWQDFIDRNQGHKLYSQAQEILCAIYNNQSVPIPDDWKLHAYLNSELAKTFDLYDGMLYNNDYPNSTTKVYDIVIKHLQEFDKRF